MKYGDEGLRRFQIGDNVRVKSGLQVGKMYYTGDKGDTFTSRMRKNIGREGRVIEMTFVGYRLDFDPIHTYTDEMLDAVDDIMAKSKYIRNEDIEDVLRQSMIMYYQNQIDKALDNRMFETEPDKFREMVDRYKELFDENMHLS